MSETLIPVLNSYNAGFSDGYAAGQTSLSKIAVVYGTSAYAQHLYILHTHQEICVCLILQH